MEAAPGISAAEFAAAFNVNVTSEVTVGMVASSSGAASVVYTYTPPPPITLTCPTGSSRTGSPYSSALVATGGVPPYTFSIASGSLPPGASLNATGDLKGTPTTVGTFNFTALVADSTGTAAGTTTAHCTITNSNPVIVSGWRRLPPPLPPTGECPDAVATVPSARIVVVNGVPRVAAREYPQDYRRARQTPYFIAFTDSSVRLADAYWVRDETLYYVTADHVLEEAPLNSLDRTISERLNCEKNLPFYLPAELQ
jgi:hypothetical protein